MARITKQQKSQIILTILENTINSKTPVDWSDIMKAIRKDAGFEVKNWLTEVRSVLQYDINRGRIMRVGGIHVETYATVK